jgi:predicted dienelactone hydrolase
MMRRFLSTSLVVVVCALIFAPALWAGYDPLSVDDTKPQQKDLVVNDAKRSREIPIRVYLPKPTTQPAAVVLFSHGLGGNRAGSAYLGEHWATRGYVVVYLQHPGSDDSVWKDKPIAERMAALRNAANLANFRLRVEDIKAVLDQLDAWNTDESHALSKRLDLKHVGMSGHSFGAVTTQAVSGQTFPAIGQSLTDARITAAVMMSPSVPRKGGDVKQSFGQVKIPWMLLTGTKDNAPIGDIDAKARRDIFPALPPGAKYELVLNGAEHSAFTDRALPGDKEKRNPNHHRAILAVTTAFWDAYLRNDDEARAWLESPAVRIILEQDDIWQQK